MPAPCECVTPRSSNGVEDNLMARGIVLVNLARIHPELDEFLSEEFANAHPEIEAAAASANVPTIVVQDFSNMDTTMENSETNQPASGNLDEERVAAREHVNAELKAQYRLTLDKHQDLISRAPDGLIDLCFDAAKDALWSLPEEANKKLVTAKQDAAAAPNTPTASTRKGKEKMPVTAPGATNAQEAPTFTPPATVSLADVLHDPQGPGGALDLRCNAAGGTTFSTTSGSGVDLDQAAIQRPWIIQHPPQPCSEIRSVEVFLTYYFQKMRGPHAAGPPGLPPVVFNLGAWPAHAGAARRCQNHGAHAAPNPHFTCNACENFADRLMRAYVPGLFGDSIWMPTCATCSLGWVDKYLHQGAGRCLCPVGRPSTWTDHWTVLGKFFCIACRLNYLLERASRGKWAWESRSRGRKVITHNARGEMCETMVKDECHCGGLLDGGRVTTCPMCSGINVDSVTNGEEVFAMSTRRAQAQE